ncbi:nuclear pore complex protein Nup50 [Episyrphus balteatus]|uniref:nuclear pore complex protein Nup50 n=1 Tax=Episyrphus balteatus TaxID=286459 RepID=UPI002485CEF3|nr:nuclear pore complex protein Nup50 [Episyrphus balteatus]
MSASSKRRATSDLNHDNWDRETEPETRGTFQSAPEDELKNRVIRKAHRKLAGTSDSTLKAEDAADGGQTKGVFSGFSGFGKTPSTATTLSSLSSTDSTKKPGETKPATSTFSFLNKFTPSPSSTSAASEAKTDTVKKNPLGTISEDNASANNNKYDFEKSSVYYAKLKGLNQAVSTWIKTHVDKNPLCLLTPIFKDYEKYLAEIEKTEGQSNTGGAPQSQAMNNFKFQSATPPTSSANIFSFGKKTTTDSTDSTAEPKKTTSIFGSSAQSSEEKPKASTGFSFGSKSDSTPSVFPVPSSTGFMFGGSTKPFSFGNIQPPPAAEPTPAADDKENGDEEDEPPKVEFKAVVEEDSVYSKRCKVFVKNDGNFTDRGVGTLYLKPVKDSEKKQLLVRADTNLGNILVNLILNDSIPTQRMGKNNVMLVCIPTPDTDKPTPMLLRVKTSDEADELLETIDKYKK